MATRGGNPSSLIVGVVVALLATGLLGYSCSRAARLGFTHDESYTYLHYVQPRAGAAPPATANDHLLNTALMRLCVELTGGRSELVLRLPGLLAHLLYLLASWLLARRLRAPPARLAGFVLLNLHPYLLDFFGLARGYGLALALELLALHQLLRLLERRKRAGWWSHAIGPAACFACAALATLANLALLHFFAALLCVWLLNLLARLRADVDADADADAGVSGARRGALHGRLLLAGLGPPLLCAGVLAAALAGQITRLRAGGQLYFGGDRGFWSDTILSLADRLLYDAPALRGAAPIVGLAALLLVALTAGLYGLSVRKDPSIPRPPLALLLLLLCGLSSMGAHWLLGVKFLIERSALFLLPLLALAVAELLDGLLSTRRLRLVGLGLALTLPAALAWHAAGTLNLTHTLDWRYDADTARALAALGQQRPHPTVTLGAHWLHEPTLSFYRETLQLTWLAPITRRATLPPDADCLLLLPDAPPPPGYRFLRRFPLSRTTLLCR